MKIMMLERTISLNYLMTILSTSAPFVVTANYLTVNINFCKNAVIDGMWDTFLGPNWISPYLLFTPTCTLNVRL